MPHAAQVQCQDTRGRDGQQEEHVAVGGRHGVGASHAGLGQEGVGQETLRQVVGRRAKSFRATASAEERRLQCGIVSKSLTGVPSTASV